MRHPPPSSTLNFFIANARSLYPKQEELLSAVQSCTADVVVVSETWLTADILNSELILNDDFFIVRKDRTERRGGGVLIAIKKCLRVENFDIIPRFEGVWVRIKTHGVSVIVIACYKPPGLLDLSPLLHEFMELLVRTYPNDMFVLAGDFNFPGIVWPTFPSSMPFESWFTLPKQSREFVDVTRAFSLCQIISQPTRGSAVLDLFFTSKPERVVSVHFMEPLSDHVSINIEMAIPAQKQIPLIKTISNYLKDLREFNIIFGSVPG